MESEYYTSGLASPATALPSVSSETDMAERDFDYPLIPAFGPGIYQVTGLSSAKTLEHNAGDNSVIKSDSNDEDNQKWEFISLGAGYLIRCIQTSQYLNHRNEMRNGSEIIMSDYPGIWSVNYDEKRGLATISCPNTNYYLDMYPERLKVVLYEGVKRSHEFNQNQWFRLCRVGPPSRRIESSDSTVHETHRNSTDGAWTTTTTTIVKTITTTIKTTRRIS